MKKTFRNRLTSVKEQTVIRIASRIMVSRKL